MKKWTVLAALAILFLSSVSNAMGNSQDQNNSQKTGTSMDQAKQDYRLYLAKLKELTQQYDQVTSQVKKVIKEEGVPTWDEKSGKIKITHDLDLSDNGPIRETETEIKVVLEAPGLKKDSLRVNVENENILHIHAVKKAVNPDNREEPYEQNYELPSPVQDKNTSAKYEDGILTVTLRKIPVTKKIVPVTVE